ncbi:sensor histidine kinase [Sphaerisporangium album]|uniref:histidine kinase n=1 Tax=Sphaerisporangium album TaxID=509200 RepID=A0A367FQB6_9ACTN|nr:HAMP domain-containing sensor histidine kinase [Sphaerisporangium album]RCG32583.1 sensor histidine kinase [Sphaerisporangium album]
MIRELLTVVIEDDHDVFTVRQMGREVAEAVGLDELDRIRVGTALSEVGREIVGGARRAEIGFLVDDATGLVLRITYTAGPHAVAPAGVDLASRLMDRVDHDDAQRRITMVKKVPGSRDLTEATIGGIRAKLVELAPAGVLEELRQQNRELAEALEDSRRQREQLLRLNAELEETNQGVLALYNQLSEELEETNRGVVALYAELDEKSAQLREASEARNRFWATISHELRTPLNSIIGLTRLLLGPGGEELSEEQHLQVELIGNSAQTLLALVAELLDMAKAESGRLTSQPSVVDVPALADRLRMTLRPTTGTDRVRLTVDVARAPETLLTDEVLLSRVLRNLLSNALKFTEQGEVRLTAHTEDAEVVFVVADTGVGIPEEHQQHVFEEFFQIPGAIQTRARGTGLGLPYARRLTEVLGGTLQLASVPGEGTTVTVRLPALSRMDSRQAG